jgi:hypothetical protein
MTGDEKGDPTCPVVAAAHDAVKVTAAETVMPQLGVVLL